MLQDKHILVVEREFLDAMDIQRILEGAGAASIVFARGVEELDGDRLPRLDLAIVETAPEIAGTPALIDRLRAGNVAIVMTLSAGSDHASAAGPVLLKPVAETELLAACVAALAFR
jgi:hypothetical protein